MSTYKTLSPNDISRVPFNTNRQFSFISSSASTSSIGIHFQQFEYSASALNTFSGTGKDPKNVIKYYQLDHLFYKNHRLDISNKLGDADYLNQSRNLYSNVNVLTIPSKLFGNQIKRGTFYYSGSNGAIIDDKRGNLIISGTNLVSHSIDEREKVLSIGPIKGFKRYDVNYNLYGKTDPNNITRNPIDPRLFYNNSKVYDDSYYNNILNYKNIKFSKENYGTNISCSRIDFVTKRLNISHGESYKITSSIVAPHNETYNFNPGEDFTISMYINPVSGSGYLIAKSAKTSTLPVPLYQPLSTTGSSQIAEIKSKKQNPFEVYIDSSNNLCFSRTDGTYTPKISSSLNTGSLSHIVCMNSASMMEMWINGIKVTSGSDTTQYRTENKANLYIGSRGEIDNYYTGSMSQIMVFNSSRTEEQIKALSSSINGSPYIGNIFYSNGLVTITHPKYQNMGLPPVSNGFSLKFKNIHPIYENEYMCTVNADEYNYTHNISTRKIQTTQNPVLSNFATSSLFKPYVTTVGLYNEDNELLVVGKLGQPIRMSDETDTTFVLRWDT